MERKWLALTPGDTLPLRLGAAVVPDAAALRLPVPEPDVGVRWVHGSTRDTDLAHEAAPTLTVADLEHYMTKAWVVDEASSWECGPSGMDWNKDQYAELQLSTDYEVSVEADGRHVLRKHRLDGSVETVNLSRPDLKNGDVLKIRLDAENCDVKVFRQGVEVPQHAPENPRLAAEQLRPRKTRAMLDQMHMATNPPKIMIDPGRPGGDMTAWTKTWVDDKGNVHVESIKVEDIYAEPSAMTAWTKTTRCSSCGVSEGQKHFLSCWTIRPDLLDT